MGLVFKIFKYAVPLSALVVAYMVYQMLQPPPVPGPLPDVWWGPGSPPAKSDESIREFKIHIPDQAITDLNRRLASVPPLTPPLEDAAFTYGFNTKTLQEIITFWKTKYSWRERETFLNKYPQFKTRIQGLDIHFLHIKPRVSEKDKARGVQVLPLLLLHGWPGSVREFYEIIPMLSKVRDDYNFVFELVVPSLPGYGFSDPAVRRGLHTGHIAKIMAGLMKRLRYKQFFVQGGDWGSFIADNMAVFHPDVVRGVHSNMCFTQSLEAFLFTILGDYIPSLVVPAEHHHMMYPLKYHFKRIMRETGYVHLQATKPDTIGVALRDSPVGLAAYILEKFSTWTNNSNTLLDDGGLMQKYTYTDLLDNVMIYWFTGTITTSIRLYSETFDSDFRDMQLGAVPVKTPTACARFPNEINYQPDGLLRSKYHDLVHANDMPRGGHFAAFEEPELLSEDIWNGIKKMLQVEETKKRRMAS